MRVHLLCIHKRISCVYTQHSCACSGPGTPGARDPKKRSLVYTQEILFCIHNKCILIISYYNNMSNINNT